MVSEKSIVQELKIDQNIVVMTSTEGHRKTLIKLCKEAHPLYKNVCIITITKPYPAVAKELAAAKIDTSHYYFIDCISARHTDVKDTANCTYVASPEILTEISVAISRAMRKPMDLLILDNISSLAIYNKGLDVLKFLHGLMVKLQRTQTKGLYLFLKGGLDKSIIADLSLFVDKIVTR